VQEAGLSKLVKTGYCPDHAHITRQTVREGFDRLKKTPEQMKFYASTGWSLASKRHRAIEPLCRRCREAGKVVPGALAHHNPSLVELLTLGLNPADDRYLETLCVPCHNKELSGKRKVALHGL